MDKDNTVYLLIGQRGSGKTMYASRLVKSNCKLSLISRDEIFIRICGSTDTDPYSGAHHYIQMIMHRLLKRKLSTKTGLRLILDAWTENSEERKLAISMLKQYGASRVIALYFITSLENVNIWFWEKPGIAKMKEMESRRGEGLTFFSEHAPSHDYKVFHELASGIDSDGFDEVIRIDPEKEMILLS